MTRRYVAFIRAVNVGTTNRIKMADLADVMGAAGCSDVTWHLQAGNMFFAAASDTRADSTAAAAASSSSSVGTEALACSIETALADHGLVRADVMLWTARELSRLIERDPFSGVDPDGHRLCVAFMRRPPAATPTDKLERAGADVRYLDDRVLCYSLPAAAGARELAAAAIDKPWRTSSTVRWWNVVTAVAARAVELEG